VRLEVRAEVRKTESVEKVRKAILNIFPEVRLEEAVGEVRGESADVRALSRFRELLRKQAILDAARSVMKAGLSENMISFRLNKQVAYVGKVNFTNGEAPMGPIVVSILAEDPERMIDYLAPRTKNGMPVQEVDYDLDP